MTDSVSRPTGNAQLLKHELRILRDVLLRLLLASIFVLLSAIGCSAVQQPVEGYYRHGHKVNTVCIDEPKACYWLVDTDPEVCQQLKQLTVGQAQYTPVCVKLMARLSAEKADGFGGDYDGSISVQQLLGRCDTTRAQE